MSHTTYKCWVCNSGAVSLERQGTSSKNIGATDFQITDANYGRTADLYRCSNCHFLFCPELTETLGFYTEMEDQGYEETREERALQARQLLKIMTRHKPNGRLLDVGAGSGILVEQASKAGYEAEGIEPSHYLYKAAQQRQLPVRQGVLPDTESHPDYDVVTLIDVIEHVENPGEILQEITKILDEQGICVIVTPDLSSLAARLMGRHWWHFRLAHIGYFTPKTLRQLTENYGLEIVSQHKPGWYFPASYLLERLLSYLPRALRFQPPRWLDHWVIPLNLHDSLLIVCRKRQHD